MKIALVMPQSDRPALAPKSGLQELKPPIGLLALAAAIRDEHDVRIIDAQAHRKPPGAVAQMVAEGEPDAVGISVPFSSLWRSARGIAAGARDLLGRDVPLIWGGVVPTFRAEQVLRDCEADIVLRHETDRTFPALLRGLNDGSWRETPGVSYLGHSGAVVEQPFDHFVDDLDSLPFPAYDLLDAEERYRLSLISTRGCPHACIYCSTRAMWGPWRARSADNVLAEIAASLDRRQIDRFDFVDDNFSAVRRRVFEFCDGVQEAGWDLRWGFSARVEQADRDLLERCSDAGCRMIFFGVESGSERVLQILGRRYGREQIIRAVDDCIECGILPICSFMVGVPGETEADAEHTLEMLERLNTPRLQLHVFTPLIGTPVYENAEQYGVECAPGGMSRETIDGEVHHRTRELSRDQIRRLYLEGQGIIAERAPETQRYAQFLQQIRQTRM